MKSFILIGVYLLAGHQPDETAAKPFGEVIFKKNHEFLFKPFLFKPITFIKEKIGPFGYFGEKHGIEKRDVVEASEDNLRRVPLERDMSRLPAEVFEFPEGGGPVVLITPPTPKKDVALHTDIHRDEQINNYLNSIEGIYPIHGAEKPVELEKPKPQEVPPADREDLIKKSSRWAFYIGNAVVKILSQFLEGAKAKDKPDLDNFFGKNIVPVPYS